MCWKKIQAGFHSFLKILGVSFFSSSLVLSLILFVAGSDAMAGQERAQQEKAAKSRKRKVRRNRQPKAVGKPSQQGGSRAIQSEPGNAAGGQTKKDTQEEPVLLDFSVESVPPEPAKDKTPKRIEQAAEEKPKKTHLPEARVAVFQPNWWRRNESTLRYCGYGMSGAGLISLGVGIYLGIHSQSLRDSIHDDTSQIEADRLARQANDAAGQANIMYIVSAAAAAAGATLIVIPYIMGEDTDTTATISMKPGAVFAGVETRW